LWNAGIVVAQAHAIIGAIQKHEPEVLRAVERSLANGRKIADDIYLNRDDFVASPSLSFDHAVLERHNSVAVTALDAMWRDVGTWSEVAELYTADGDGNRQVGKVHLASSRDTFVFSTNRLTVGVGLTDLIVVDTPDVLLIANRSDLGLMREVVEVLSLEGYSEIRAEDDAVRMNRITLGVGEMLRGLTRKNSAQHWIVLCGTVTVTIGSEASIYGINESFHVPPDTDHTVSNGGLGSACLVVLQVTRSALPDF
jgi:mannose-6-phosphate isomerase-like protein (cupin superfamily)